MTTELIHGDCLKEMDALIARGVRVDMILTDPPYGITEAPWDKVIDIAEMWKRVNAIIKDNGAILLFGKQPFFSELVISNKEKFRYEIIWDKKKAPGFLQANKKFLSVHENIAVFGSAGIIYNRIDDAGFPAYTDKRTTKNGGDLCAKGLKTGIPRFNKTTRAPTTIRRVFPDNMKGLGSSLHPTQKPVALLEGLILAYTLEGETVLDFTMGSGSTGIACKNLNRNFIGIELDEKYFNIAKKRIENHIGVMQTRSSLHRAKRGPHEELFRHSAR